MKAKYLLCPAAFLLLASCNENEVFTKEQYKHVFSFVSNADHVSDKVFNLSDTARVGYIALSMGGSTGTDKDVTVNIVKAPEVLENYNVAQFDNAVDKYARLLPESHYTMASMTFVVKAGHTTGVIPVTVGPKACRPTAHTICLCVYNHMTAARQIPPVTTFSTMFALRIPGPLRAEPVTVCPNCVIPTAAQRGWLCREQKPFTPSAQKQYV